MSTERDRLGTKVTIFTSKDPKILAVPDRGPKIELRLGKMANFLAANQVASKRLYEIHSKALPVAESMQGKEAEVASMLLSEFLAVTADRLHCSRPRRAMYYTNSGAKDLILELCGTGRVRLSVGHMNSVLDSGILSDDQLLSFVRYAKERAETFVGGPEYEVVNKIYAEFILTISEYLENH